MKTILSLLFAPVDWLSTRLVQFMTRGFDLRGPFLLTSSRSDAPRRAPNIDGTPMISDTIDMKGKPFGF
ncbi:hypothetical protein LRS03_08910 [Rhizobacter sp. J219]|uniref:hypothetical protein n=1 Tax=Rhizobacter sp. J219 TaxID=2898430 RepID=UPI002151F6F9|nr:hypothetical protein [Rhizobacter sp. J219]MCR5882969.1 hypothetical protein [Rhizobacter sp. J219]